MLTWGEFKKRVEAAGIEDDFVIDRIDICGDEVIDAEVNIVEKNFSCF